MVAMADAITLVSVLYQMQGLMHIRIAPSSAPVISCLP
jgi:hypothetical protein